MLTLSQAFHAMHKALAIDLVKAAVLCITLKLWNALFQYLYLCLNFITWLVRTYWAGTAFLPVMDKFLYKYNSMEAILSTILIIKLY